VKSEKGKKVIGFLFSFLSWWFCVLVGKYFGSNIQMILFPLFIIFSFLIHYSLFVEFPKPFTLFYFTALILGLSADGLFLALDQFNYEGPRLLQFPLWLLCLWFVFPFNFLHSFRKFMEKPIMGIGFGIIGGSLAYSAGPKLGILNLSPYALFYVGIFWGFYMGVIYWISKKLPV
jgi:hypothetical protein